MSAALRIVSKDDHLSPIRAGRQTLANTFYLGGKFYNGRIEDARLYYQDHPEVYEMYSFEEYVDMTYYEFRKPVLAIKQELVNLCTKYMEPNELVKVLFLIDKL
jgi:hypothetical protein